MIYYDLLRESGTIAPSAPNQSPIEVLSWTDLTSYADGYSSWRSASRV